TPGWDRCSCASRSGAVAISGAGFGGSYANRRRFVAAVSSLIDAIEPQQALSERLRAPQVPGCHQNGGMRRSKCPYLAARLDVAAAVSHPTGPDAGEPKMLLPDPAQLSRMMSEAMAPAFVLGAVAGFVSILLGRLTAVVDRIRSLNDVAEDDP